MNMQRNFDAYSCNTLSNPMSVLPDNRLIIDVSVEVLEDDGDVNTLEDFENALNTYQGKIHPNAPSYYDLLKKHNPEYLL
jgi:hypothetical protein